MLDMGFYGLLVHYSFMGDDLYRGMHTKAL
jgi:hypothetical protein